MLEDGLTNSEYELLEGSFKAEPEDEFPYTCSCCKKKFEEWKGGLKVKNENENYCPDCVDNNKHTECIRDYCETISDSPTTCAKAANQIIEEMIAI